MTSPDTEFISILGASGSPEAPARVSTSSLPDVLPILGLSDIVIFPGMVAPLLVETPQSTKLIDDVVGGDRLLGVALQRNAEAENPLPHEMHDVGCAARVLKMLKERGVQIRVPSAIWDSLMALRRARNEFVHFAPMLLVARSGSRGYSPRKIASRSNL